MRGKVGKPWKKLPMVGWYDPSQLARTGVRTLVSTLLGSMIDTRRFGPSEGKDSDCIIDYSDRNEVWFDYMADTGDGWNPTYTMAYLLSSPAIKLASGRALPRADFVILGGDEVYPVASKMAYAQRLVWPFNEVARRLGQYAKVEHLRDIYCIPGNHDWYDSLAAFTRRFCGGRTFGCFRTRQVRSYFVLKLPHNWQIWAADIQLGHDIDVHQLRFFREHAKSLTAQDRIILCLAEPDWVYGEQAGEDLHFNIERLERQAEACGAKVVLELAGDIHNYQRYEGVRDPSPNHARPKGEPRKYEAYKQTKIVSGGGGAFLHPTHTFPSRVGGPTVFTCESRYPPTSTSSLLSLGNLLFAFKNWKMSVLLGLLYLLIFWGADDFTLMTYPIDRPGSFVLMLGLLAGFYAFADLGGVRKVAWGLAHGVSHMVLALLCWMTAPRLLPEAWLAHAALETYVPRLAVLLMGALLGGTLFGIYLFLSVNALGIHENEAFSSLRIDSYKHFLRCHLGPGGLKVHVIGVEKVASDDKPHPVSVKLVDVMSIG